MSKSAYMKTATKLVLTIVLAVSVSLVTGFAGNYCMLMPLSLVFLIGLGIHATRVMTTLNFTKNPAGAASRN